MIKRKVISDIIIPNVNFIFSRLVHLESWNLRNLSSPFWRLYYLYDDGLELEHEHQVFQLKQHQWVLIAPNTPAQGKTCRPCRKYFLHFHLFGVEYPADTPIFVGNAHEHTRQAMDDLLNHHDGDQSHSPWSIIGEALPHLVTSRTVPQDELMWLAAERCRENLMLPLRMDQMANELNLSVNHFLRRFKAEFQCSPHQFRIGARLDKACEYLIHSEMSIDDIAVKTGFFDRFALSKTFKHKRGLTPVQYRNEQGVHGQN